jgi:hypothetical protein
VIEALSAKGADDPFGDQVAHLGAQTRAAARATGAPADDGLGSDQDQVAPPVAAESAGQDPQQLVTGTDAGAWRVGRVRTESWWRRRRFSATSSVRGRRAARMTLSALFLIAGTHSAAK